jgi:hypothetical protein
MGRPQHYNQPYFFWRWSQERAPRRNVGAALIARGEEHHDDIVDDTTMTQMTIATIVIVATVAANLDATDTTVSKKATAWQQANAGSAARATSVKQRSRKKPWARRNERQNEEKVGHDDCKRRLRDDEQQRGKPRQRLKKKMVASDGESEDDNEDDNFVLEMAPSAKKAMTNDRVIPKKARKVVEPMTKMRPPFCQVEETLGWQKWQSLGQLMTARISKKRGLVKN